MQKKMEPVGSYVDSRVVKAVRHLKSKGYDRSTTW